MSAIFAGHDMATVPKPAADETKFEKLRATNNSVYRILDMGGTAEDCCVFLAEQNEKLVERLALLETIAPKRIRLPSGGCAIWHCPDELIPETKIPESLSGTNMASESYKSEFWTGVAKDVDLAFQTTLNEDYAKAVAEETEQKGGGK